MGPLPHGFPQLTLVTLTPTERQILLLLARGLSVPEVADAMDLDPERVRAYLFAVQTRLGASSRLETLLLVIRHGLIVVDD